MPEVRTLFAIENEKGWNLYQLDVTIAFINLYLDKKVLMEIPEGINVSSDFRKRNVSLVQRALYGLKTSPKRWWLCFCDVWLKMNFQVYKNQACLFFWKHPKRGNETKDQVAYILLYVDDILITGNCKSKILETRKWLNEIFEMKNISELLK